MTQSGFVLAGGASTRMGRDKASLPYRGTSLVDHVAGIVREAAGNVVIIRKDKIPGCGPLGGLFTALSDTQTDWNLVVACDMPGLSTEPLRILLKRAAITDQDCVAAASPDGMLEPLCAVYHRRCLPVVERAIRDKRLKMMDLLAELAIESQPLDPIVLANANTPSAWAAYENGPK